VLNSTVLKKIGGGSADYKKKKNKEVKKDRIWDWVFQIEQFQRKMGARSEATDIKKKQGNSQGQMKG